MLKKFRLILLQLFTENIINPIWFRIVKWYEQRLVKLIEVEDDSTGSTESTDVSI